MQGLEQAQNYNSSCVSQTSQVVKLPKLADTVTPTKGQNVIVANNASSLSPGKESEEAGSVLKTGPVTTTTTQGSTWLYLLARISCLSFNVYVVVVKMMFKRAPTTPYTESILLGRI